jgi:hypothetical protein
MTREAAERTESKEEAIKADFLAHDKANRRAVLLSKGLRENERPWAVTNHVSRYRQTRFPFQTITFHQGARVHG